MLFQKFVRENIYTIPRDVSAMWVKERIIPSGRQNIGAILKSAKMNEYNELILLGLSKGRCSQDGCYLEEIDYGHIPEDIRQRSDRNVEECFCVANQMVVCMFRDQLVRKVSLPMLERQFADVACVLKNQALMNSVKVGIGGYSITFNDSIEIPVSALRDEHVSMPLSAEDFRSFVRCNIADTTKVCDLLQCSRQNVSYLAGTGRLVPILSGTKENLYTLGNIERIRTE